MNIIEKVFGTHSTRELRRIESTIEAIEALRPSMMELTDDQLRGKTEEYKKRGWVVKTYDYTLIIKSNSFNSIERV